MLTRPNITRLLSTCLAALLIALSPNVAVGSHGETSVHPQPDGGSIELSADWVIAKLADAALDGEDGAVIQELISARRRFAGKPAVLRAWRTSPPEIASSMSSGIRDQMQSDGIDVKTLAAPQFTPPPGMRAQCELVSYRFGTEEMRSLTITCVNSRVGHLLALTWSASSDSAVAPVRSALLKAWVPSGALNSRAGIPLQLPQRKAVRFSSGEQATVAEGWQVVASDLTPDEALRSANSPDARMLLSLRRFDAPPAPTAIMLLSRLEGGSIGLRDAVRFVTTDIEAIAGPFGLRVKIEEHAVDATTVELTGGPLPQDLYATARVERRDGVFLLATAYTRDPTDGMSCVRNLLASVPPMHPSATAPSRTAIAPLRDAQPRDIESRYETTASRERGLDIVEFAQQLGGTTGIGIFMALPALIAGIWSRRAAAIALACSALLLGWAISAGNARYPGGDIRERQGPNDSTDNGAQFRPAAIDDLHSVQRWNFVLDTLGETALTDNGDDLDTIAFQFALGNDGDGRSVLAALAVGSVFALAGPLLIRFAWLAAPCRKRRGAYLAGLAWLLIGVGLLSSLGSTSEPHRALVLGSTLMTVLLLPASRKQSSQDSSEPSLRLRSAP